MKKSSQDRDIKDVLEGGEVSVPIDGMDEPRFRREGGTRDMVLPGNTKFIEGDMLPRPSHERRQGQGRGRGRQRRCVPLVLSRDEFVDLFLDDLELPDLAKRKLAEVESQGIRRAGYTTSGSPAISRWAERSVAPWRGGSRCDGRGRSCWRLSRLSWRIAVTRRAAPSSWPRSKP